MKCRNCGGSQSVQKLTSEIAIHVPGGRESLTKPHVLVFPKISVCFDCGFAEFAVPDEQLRRLRNPESSEQATRAAS